MASAAGKIAVRFTENVINHPFLSENPSSFPLLTPQRETGSPMADVSATISIHTDLVKTLYIVERAPGVGFTTA
jgi:hypothetical protein